MMKRNAIAGLVAAVMLLIGSVSFADQGANSGATEYGTVTVKVPAGFYDIQSGDEGYYVSVDGFGRLLVPGKPDLPSRIFSIAIPPGASLVDVAYETSEGEILSGSYDVRPSRLPRVVGEEDPLVYQRDREIYQANFEAVYNSDDPYPAENVELVGPTGFRQYNLVDVRVTPITYHPVSGQLTYYSEITIHVRYAMPDKSVMSTSTQERTEKLAQDIIYNYDQTSEWYSKASLDKGLHDFVIITLESLVSSVDPLVVWEFTKGRTVEVVTTATINAGYSGYDLAEKIRNFLRENYPSDAWGIQDVLLVGDYDDVPMRRCSQDVGYGMPETDFYYAELSLPDSLSWDSDGDHSWGENSDYVDFQAEVNVGRIPWSEPSTVLSICQKSVAFEQNTDPSFKKNMLLLGGYFWDDTDNAVLMEAKIDQPWMSDWTFTRMYEQNVDYWSTFACDYPLLNTNVMSIWPNGSFCFVNWGGHGSPTSSHILGIGQPAFISSSDCAQLNDDYPAIIFADACSNSDTDHLNIGQSMIKQGGVAFLGATKVAMGCPGWTNEYDGSSQSLDYFFTTAVTSHDYTVGGAHQYALRQMYTMGLWGYQYYEAFEWGALWGNPNLGLSLPGMAISLPSTPESVMPPGVEDTINVIISSGIDFYVPGSGTLYYRYDGGSYQTLPLVDLGNNLFAAYMPAPSCGDTPEFYFSAEGLTAGVIYEPSGAPASTYTALVGEMVTIYSDNFETDQGWTVENSPGLGDGPWERGVPVGLGERGDPPTDFDGSSACYLTDNLYGNSDVDDGTTTLISPVYDVSGYDAKISYARWYSNTYGDNPNADTMFVRISSNGGVDWMLAEQVGPVVQAGGGWFKHEFWVSDFFVPTDQVMLRFEVSDLGGGSVVEAGLDDFQFEYLQCGPAYMCGDTDGSESIDIDDAVFLINYIFASGPAPDPMESGDADCSGDVDIDDAVYLITYIFSGGAMPCDPDNDGTPDC